MLFHIISRLRPSKPLWTNRSQARQIARVILKFGRKYRLVLFAVPGDHIHTVVRCSRLKAGRWARALEAAITRVLCFNPGFRPAHIVPVETFGHQNHIAPYVLGQYEKHQVVGDPLLE
ncbi:MAG: hypothetical protein GY913_07640 [Proteobacteria bacterium]|nr:hypothetical protein [Pseudomonadota bacterium]MCP4916783.1 hypothetical protein [Pseudomonadota bacterium]